MGRTIGKERSGRVVDYYFSPSSPWTYLGHGRLVSIAARHQVEVNVKPIDLANRIFPVSGGLPVSQRPAQRLAYREVELRRWSGYLDMKLNLKPRKFPVVCDLASKLIISTDLLFGSQKALELTGHILAGVWARELDIADASTLFEMASAVGVDSKELMAGFIQDEAKNCYTRYTQEAMDRQVFGAPFYFFKNEPFWGQDRLEFLERAVMDSA